MSWGESDLLLLLLRVMLCVCVVLPLLLPQLMVSESAKAPPDLVVVAQRGEDSGEVACTCTERDVHRAVAPTVPDLEEVLMYQAGRQAGTQAGRCSGPSPGRQAPKGSKWRAVRCAYPSIESFVDQPSHERHSGSGMARGAHSQQMEN